MPYADPEKRKELDRQRKAMARAAAKVQGQNNERVDVKARAWTIVAYPESVPKDWREVLNEYHIPWACSPLHDKDVDGAGKLKIPHLHILLSFTGKKSYSQICVISKALNAPSPKVCHDQRGLVRYFIHRDDPNKYQYDQRGIEVYGGFDVADYLKPTTSECMALQDEMIEWCFKNKITEFWILKVYALRERPDWSAELSRSCFQITQFLKSRRHSSDLVACNPETGEIYE